MVERSDPRRQRPSPRQGDLFSGSATPPAQAQPAATLVLQAHQLEAWQDRLGAHQAPLFAATGAAAARGGTTAGLMVTSSEGQLGLFAPVGTPGCAALSSAAEPGASAPLDPQQLAQRFNPHSLRDQHLQFWRWPAPPQQGAALYLVLDRPARLAQPLLLYVGETGQADRRWKGEHDCKGYLGAYSEALHGAGLGCQLSIRFWCDVPAAVRPRRALEQALIRRWLPPFNKETRDRWATPFTALAD
jgi:hypothetical protein